MPPKTLAWAPRPRNAVCYQQSFVALQNLKTKPLVHEKVVFITVSQRYSSKQRLVLLKDFMPPSGSLWPTFDLAINENLRAAASHETDGMR